jgi:7-cyano-7-deazaguanine synthase in queuosine biosynthesis
MFNGAPPRARVMRWKPIEDGVATGLEYDIDGRFSGEVRVDWSELGGAPPSAESRVLGVTLAAIIAQHALPLRVEGPVLGDASGGDALRRILGMLYDIRAFCDETALRGAVTLEGKAIETRPGAARGRSQRRVLVLLSGGFDSTFAALLLREAGYELEALHVRTNRHVEEPEERAARAIAAALEIPIRTVRIHAPDQERIGRYYSRTFGIYPFYNSIPHGRDFPLAAIAWIAARRVGCGLVAFGHEKESRRKVVPFRKTQIYRHDVESAYGADLVRSFLRASFGTDVNVFSPLAGLSIYRIRAAVLSRFPALAREVQFCFWTRRCEKCLKCLSTYTMQRHLDVSPIPFDQNLFADVDDQDMALLSQPDRPSEALAYGPQMHYAMRRIIADGLDRDGDYWLDRFRETGLRQVEERWPLIESVCLAQEHPQEVPDDVRSAAARLVR